MPLDHSVTITGTDPQNIRTAGHAVQRLDQLARDLTAMHDEFRREALQIDMIVSSCLTDYGMSRREASGRSEFVRSEFAALAGLLEQAYDQAKAAREAIHLSGVKLNYRSEWRPTRTS
jgi:hypothetical protein